MLVLQNGRNNRPFRKRVQFWIRNFEWWKFFWWRKSPENDSECNKKRFATSKKKCLFVNRVQTQIKAYDFLDLSISVTKKGKIQWKKEPLVSSVTFSDFKKKKSEIRRNKNLSQPMEYFRRFLPNDFFKEISFLTNLYAVQKNIRNFKPTSDKEIHILVGL